mmetsp:Transcript_127656/g.397577  ORF Transcript_127656/g.397577 Transcript_127656/m.397577 type:complete len:235 (-) Transcript_127656:1171-1875(-)
MESSIVPKSNHVVAKSKRLEWEIQYSSKDLTESLRSTSTTYAQVKRQLARDSHALGCKVNCATTTTRLSNNTKSKMASSVGASRGSQTARRSRRKRGDSQSSGAAAFRKESRSTTRTWNCMSKQRSQKFCRRTSPKAESRARMAPRSRPAKAGLRPSSSLQSRSASLQTTVSSVTGLPLGASSLKTSRMPSPWNLAAVSVSFSEAFRKAAMKASMTRLRSRTCVRTKKVTQSRA